METTNKFAMVIDADNASAKKIEAIIQEVSKRGQIVLKRVYGNWSKTALSSWKTEIKRLAIKPVQQFDYVKGKNATDIAMVIDTMELLHRNLYDGFVIVSSDSDYTPLCIQLREQGKIVIGVGEKKTPESFINACEEFIFVESLTSTSVSNIDEVHNSLKTAYDTYRGDDDFAKLSAAGAYIKRIKPDFDTHSYGYDKLLSLLEAFPDKYEIQKHEGRNGIVIIEYKVN